jgi:hypothetical protein
MHRQPPSVAHARSQQQTPCQRGRRALQCASTLDRTSTSTSTVSHGAFRQTLIATCTAGSSRICHIY